LPSEKPLQRVLDIIENAEATLSYTSGMDFEALTKDRKTYDAGSPLAARIRIAAT